MDNIQTSKITDEWLPLLTVVVVVLFATKAYPQAPPNMNSTKYIHSSLYLFGMGDNNLGQLGDGTTIHRHTPIQITNDAVRHASITWSHNWFVKEDGNLWGMGSNSGNLLDLGSTNLRLIPIQITDNVSHVSAGISHISWIKQDSTFWVKGWMTNERPDSSIQVASGVIQAASGITHTLMLNQDGAVFGMGSNQLAQLGSWPLVSKYEPTYIMDSVRFISAGHTFTLVVKFDGSLWAFGSNNFVPCTMTPCLGSWVDGTFTNRPEPFHIADNVEFATGGFQHALFIKSDSSLWGVGFNHSGTLGTGLTVSTSVPVHIADGVIHAAAGSDHSLFVKSDGSLWAMGRNHRGSLGDGTTSERLSPVHIANRVQYAYAGGSTSLFIGMGDVSLSEPANEAEGVVLSPVLAWNDFGEYLNYDVQLATDSSFENRVVETTNHDGLEWDLSEHLDELTTYYWRVRGIGDDEAGPWSPIWSFKTTSTTGIDDLEGMVDHIQLLPNYPNPFNPTTVIGFRLSETGHVRLTVHDILGREVAVMVDGIHSTGEHSATFDGSGLASGVYIYRLQVDNWVQSKKLLLMK